MMKKLLSGLLSAVLLTSSSLGAISCSSKAAKANLMGTDLSKIEDYSWSKEEPYFEGYDSYKYDLPSSSVEDLGKLDIKNKNSYLDLSNFSTAHKIKSEVEKQATTGVPLNSKFLPNGNFKSDLGLVSRKDVFTSINSIKDWSPTNDNDAKYNKSRIKLQKTTKVAGKWVNTQDEKIKEMNMATVIESTSNENTIIGKKRTYERGFNNYQYNDILVSWAGAASEGIIIPPAANQVEKAHLNGTKILGNIFLDGYHGLTKSMLKDFLEKDSNGNYIIVDKLIEMAASYGFDGWFWNNEPNGATNNLVLDYRIVIEILKQYREKVKKSTDENVKNLLMFTYKNNGTLEMNEKKACFDIEACELRENSDYFLTDFYVYPRNSKKYLEDKGLASSDERFNIFNMYNPGGWVYGDIFYNQKRIGTRDVRELAYMQKNNEDSQNPEWDTEKAWNSISMFASHVPYDLASREMDSHKNISKIDNDTYGLVAANSYDDMLYTGKNKKLSENDKGSVSWNPMDDESLKDKSYGVGNIVQEKTVLNDENPYFFTNFSTGQGRKFVSQHNGSRKTIENYPWSNTNLADVQPTYKWMITKNSQSGFSPSKEDNVGNISGYYDYYNPYMKGNSITLGSGYDDKGEISNATFEEGQSYTWNIMGANYTTGEKEISLVYKADKDSAESFDIAVTSTSGNELVKENKSDKDLGDGWRQITRKVTGKISKIGLSFTAKKKDFKVSVGELSVQQSEIKKESPANTKLSSEYIVERNNDLYNIRLNFENLFNPDDLYSFYEVYIKNEKNELIRVGESNKDNYYIKNISNSTKELFIKVTNNAVLKDKETWKKISL